MSAGFANAEQAIRDRMCALTSAAIRDLPLENVWEHAAKEIFLSGHATLNPGYFEPEKTPYTKIFQEAATGQFSNVHAEDWWLRELIARGERVDEFFAVKSSQSGFTQAAINILVFLTRYLSGRGLYCIDSREKAGKLCKFRVLPLLEKLCAGGLAQDEPEMGNYLIALLDWVWEMVGSYSAGVFSEKALNVALLDDVEYMVTEGGRRGLLDGVWIGDHARSRFTTADWHFLAVFSKPLEEGSQFIDDHRGGSQHEWLWICPRCEQRFTPELRHLYFQKDDCKDRHGLYDLSAVETLTTCKCPRCEKEIEEKWKPPMNAGGFYLPKDREARVKDRDPLMVPRRLSVRVNDMASPFAGVRWGKLAVMRVLAENNPEKMKHLVTNHGARPWRQSAVQLKDEHIKALIAGREADNGIVHGAACGVQKYKRGQVPFVPACITATSDRQGDKLKWTLCAWKLDGTCALIDYGGTLAEKALLDLCETPLAPDGSPMVCLADPAIHVHAGLGLAAGGCLIDSGFETFDVYDFCAASGWRWYPSKGVQGLSPGGYLVEGKQDFKDGRAILRYNYHDFQVKVAFYKGWIELHSHPNPERRRPSRLHLPEDVGDDFIVELLSESLQPQRTNSKRFEWVHDKSIGPNDYGDAMKMQLVLWQIVGPLLAQAAPQG